MASKTSPAPDAASPDEAGIIAWRAQVLNQAGFPPAEAFELAERPDIDLHGAVDLLGHGCPVKTALRILR